MKRHGNMAGFTSISGTVQSEINQGKSTGDGSAIRPRLTIVSSGWQNNPRHLIFRRSGNTARIMAKPLQLYAPYSIPDIWNPGTTLSGQSLSNEAGLKGTFGDPDVSHAVLCRHRHSFVIAIPKLSDDHI